MVRQKRRAEFRMVAFDELPPTLRRLMTMTNDLARARRLACVGVTSFEEAEVAIAKGIDRLPLPNGGYVVPEIEEVPPEGERLTRRSRR